MQFAVILAPIMDFLKKNWQYLFFFYLIYLLYRKLLSPSFGGSNQPVNKSNATISEQTASELSELAWQAMEEMGTDEDQLEEVYNKIGKNIDNLRLVHNSFGNRPYGTFGSPMFGSGTSLSFKGWIDRELSGDSRRKWDNLFQSAKILV